MGKVTVSVVIPVYNTREYVAEAVQSVLDQSLEGVEVIAVDDGSTDGSLAVLESFSDRIRIIRQENSGQAAARNAALREAAGEFVYFMDSDDKIRKDTLERCVERCRRDNLDFVFFDAVSFGEDFDQSACPWFDYHRSAGYTTASDGCSTIIDMLERKIWRCSVCLCLYRKDFILKNGLTFPTGILHEDESFSAAAFLKAHRVAGIPEEFYQRRIRSNSVMTTKFSQRNVDGYLRTLELVRPLGKDKRSRKAVRKLSGAYLTSLMHNAGDLPFRTRMRILWEVVFRHPHAFSLRPAAGLLFRKGLR